ncbi:intercellular adhesin biosynthesis polysaccharide N-deacetylase [Macrococcus equipercicus]|uniref:Poly-beta-1,6-N-acetyl-D-glucosamine N-deacetylase n=2 Tax=Macrococcus equipercicus TaxID=69967 RepID=A0A9Q9F301_9STAP|nr:intercellular adhesin biosynthesis polysaccharide N-deacetylase [Macrococcus equipercicus]UTH14921.1 intercellular adhesin biosynthesis polysaccharide N-deacetylase [Macrococcus equipercicus]
MLLLLLVLSLIVNDSAAAVKKLPADKNACLGLNYHRVREQNFIDSMLMLLSNSKELNIYSITDQSFDNQLKWLTAHNARFVTLDELLSYKESGHFPARCVWINFDDMDSTIEKNAQPILKKYNVPATGFVITGEVGNPNFHNLKMIDYSGLKAMEDSGLWTFASHTDKLHSIVKKTSMFIRPENQAAIQQDINNSTDYLAENLNGNVTAMAYPYGQIDDEVIEELKKTQLTYGFTLEDDVITPDSDDYYLPRILINDDSFNTLVKTWEGFQ